MDAFFSKVLEIKGLSSETALVVWSMIIFLTVLIVGIAIVFKKQFDSKRKFEESAISNASRPKGFE